MTDFRVNVRKFLSVLLGLIALGALCALAFSQNHSTDKPNLPEKTSQSSDADSSSRSEAAPRSGVRAEETDRRIERREVVRTRSAQEMDNVRSLGSLASPPRVDYGKDAIVRPPR